MQLVENKKASRLFSPFFVLVHSSALGDLWILVKSGLLISASAQLTSLYSVLDMATAQPMMFPPLPQHNNRWSADICATHEIIKRTYEQALDVLRSDGLPDPIRISFHVDALTSTALPILEALIPGGAIHEDESVPHEWLMDAARLIGQAVRDLWDMVHVVNMLFVRFSHLFAQERCLFIL